MVYPAKHETPWKDQAMTWNLHPLRVEAYMRWDTVYENTKDPIERRDAANSMNNLRKILGMSHVQIVQEATKTKTMKAASHV